MDNSVIEETTLVKGINPIHDLSSPFELTLITYFLSSVGFISYPLANICR
jgi:hypothetical protein